MKIQDQIAIHASADQVWDIIGHQYDRVSDWASSVQTSQGRGGVVLQDAPSSGRICQTDLGDFTETITHYDEHGKSLSYRAKGDKMPFFVRELSNNWTVTPISKTRCRVDMCMKVSILPVFNWVMGPLMRLQMGGVAKKATEELKYFAEQGVPHPRKLDAQKRSLKMA